MALQFAGLARAYAFGLYVSGQADAPLRCIRVRGMPVPHLLRDAGPTLIAEVRLPTNFRRSLPCFSCSIDDGPQWPL